MTRCDESPAGPALLLVVAILAAAIVGWSVHALVDLPTEKVTVRFGLEGMPAGAEMACVDEAWVEDGTLHIRDGAATVGFSRVLAWRIEPCVN